MKIVSARWQPYRLALRRPWVSAAGRFDERCGFLLRMETDDGHIGWGDAAPFPEIGIEESSARQHAEQCALLDLAAQAAGLSLAAWLRGDNSRPLPVAVNAALGDLARLREPDIETAIAAGFTVLKLKIGSADPIWEARRLEKLASRLQPGISLRLDANRAWDEKTAQRFLAACVGLPVESCEEPLCTPTLHALARLQADLPFSLAVDESFHLVDNVFFALAPVRRLILKPPRHGGLLPTIDVFQKARAAGIECVVTSSLESACGVLAAAHLAAALAPGLAHGLATSAHFISDTGLAPTIHSGYLNLPDTPGIGFEPGIS